MDKLLLLALGIAWNAESAMQPISVFLFCCLFSRFNNPTKANLILFQLVYDTFCAGKVVLWRRQSYTDNTYYLCRLANFIYCCQRMLRESPVGIIPGLRRATQRNSPFFAHLVWNINGMIYRQIFTRHIHGGIMNAGNPNASTKLVLSCMHPCLIQRCYSL